LVVGDAGFEALDRLSAALEDRAECVLSESVLAEALGALHLMLLKLPTDVQPIIEDTDEQMPDLRSPLVRCTALRLGEAGRSGSSTPI
jgi:hypothetical protein